MSCPAESATYAGRDRFILFLAVSSLGISAFVVQLTLMRELLGAFSGNELIFGVVLGSWLLLTGAGSYLGRTARRLRRPIDVLVAAQILIAVVPIVQVFVLRALRNVVFVRGSAVGPAETVISCLVLLAPYGLIAGFLLTLASLILASREEPGSIGQVYSLDNVGDIVGGLLFSFVLIYVFDHFKILYVPALLNLFFAGLVAARLRRHVLLAAVAAAAGGLVGVTLTFDLDDLSTDLQYPGQEIVYKGLSPYGSLVVTGAAGQLNFISNGVVLFSTRNIAQVEETVHYAMAQRPGAKRVLLISGGVSGTAREILKYDVVIVDVPDPSTSQINRFYTLEFFGQVKSRLNPEGVLSLSVGHYENYLSRELANLIAVTEQTLSRQFDNVRIIPAGGIYFLASDGPLEGDVAARLDAAGISTELILAILVGLEFPLAGKSDFSSVTSTAARLYLADYLGAALGALLVSTLLVPVLGVTGGFRCRGRGLQE